MKQGYCDDCGEHWSERAGGIDENGKCPMCREKFPVQSMRTGCDAPAAGRPIEDELALMGAGVC